MKFTETQLNEIARYQESRGVTRAAALKACKRAWSKGTEVPVRMIHMAAAAPALAPVVDSMEASLAEAVGSTREDKVTKGDAADLNRVFGKGKKAAKKAATPKADAEPKAMKHYVVGSTDTVKRGFLKEMIDWAGKRKSVTVGTLYAEFKGRQIDGHKVHELRIRRYVSYCVSHGILKLVKEAK